VTILQDVYVGLLRWFLLLCDDPVPDDSCMELMARDKRHDFAFQTMTHIGKWLGVYHSNVVGW
jgi:hypothetical protein